MSGGVRSPRCAGVDGGAHALVQCAARPRFVPRQLPGPSPRDLAAAGRVDGGSGMRPSSTHVGRRPTGMGCARVGPLTSSPRSSGCAARSRRRSSPTARPASLDETRGRECRCCAWRRAFRPCSARDPTGARRSAGSDRSITPAAGALVRRIRCVAFPGLRDEYRSATAPATLATSRRCRGWRRSAQPE